MPAHDANTRSAAWRVAAASLLAVCVSATIYAVGRLHQPDYTFNLFGSDPIPVKSLLATIALGLAVLQVLVALWMYRKLPLLGSPPSAVSTTHRMIGFGA